MSHRAMSWAWEQRVSPTAKLVLVALADHADEAGHCWPSVARLVEITGLSERAVRGAIGTLTGAELLRVERSGNGRGHTSRYALQLKEAPERGQEPPPSGGERVQQVHERVQHAQALTPETRHVAHPLSGERVQLLPERVHVVHERVHVVPERVQEVHPEPSRTVKNRQEPSERASRATRLPDDWRPDPTASAYCRDRGLHLRDTFEAFRDHHTAKGSRFLDWNAAWRTWCRNEVRFSARRQQPRDDAHSRRTAAVRAMAADADISPTELGFLQ